MTPSLAMADRLADLALALRKQALAGEGLMPADMTAIATALAADADRIRDAHRKAWERKVGAAA